MTLLIIIVCSSVGGALLLIVVIIVTIFFLTVLRYAIMRIISYTLHCITGNSLSVYDNKVVRIAMGIGKFFYLFFNVVCESIARN